MALHQQFRLALSAPRASKPSTLQTDSQPSRPRTVITDRWSDKSCPHGSARPPRSLPDSSFRHSCPRSHVFVLGPHHLAASPAPPTPPKALPLDRPPLKPRSPLQPLSAPGLCYCLSNPERPCEVFSSLQGALFSFIGSLIPFHGLSRDSQDALEDPTFHSTSLAFVTLSYTRPHNISTRGGYNTTRYSVVKAPPRKKWRALTGQ